MPISKEERKAEAAKHLSFVRGLFPHETEATVAAVKIYKDGEGRELALPEAAAEETKTSVTTAFSVSALYLTHGKSLLVDPASFTRPGGNYEEGAFGPEQVICSESNLYPILEGISSEYHRKNRGFARGQLFTDRAAYLADVVFSREGQIRKADVLAIPEPNRQHALENHRSERECDTCLAARIETLLRIAAANGVDNLIVGAFGCGRQGFPAAQVIKLFQNWIAAHPGAIPNIVFAVPRFQFDEFNEAFGTPEPPAQTEEPAEQEKEDENAFDPNDLPEGVTLR